MGKDLKQPRYEGARAIAPVVVSGLGDRRVRSWSRFLITVSDSFERAFTRQSLSSRSNCGVMGFVRESTTVARSTQVPRHTVGSWP
jgi:hypothetical protein